MPNPFDGYLQNAFDVTTNVMGYDAIWTPSLGGEQQTARAHYREPNEKDMIANGVQYLPFVFIMEYKVGVFVGLQESVRNGNTEIVVINGASHYVRSVAKIVDGQTFEAQLEKITD
jgi:hypothetical protein